jgi:putative transposase
LAAFLKLINAEGYRSLQDAGDVLLALHRLNVPNTLHRSLLSTNAIENTLLNTRRKLWRVTRFRAETDQASRWLSYALLEAERGFRKIAGHDSLPSLITALGPAAGTLQLTALGSHFHRLGDESGTRAIEYQDQ